MSELSAKLALLKGDRKTSEIIKDAGIARETFRKIERGDSVKLSTLRDISTAMDLTPTEWTDLIIAWLKTEAGPESRNLIIETRGQPPSLHDQPDSQVSAAMALFQNLNAAEREDITKAMERKEVRACLPSINRVWEKFSSSQTSRSKTAHKILSVVKRKLSGPNPSKAR
jgi:transcriptional regulator with XRE-family HTH domain